MEPSNNEIEVLRFLFYKVRKTSQSRNGKESKKINSTRRWEGLSELFNCPSYERCSPESRGKLIRRLRKSTSLRARRKSVIQRLN